MKRQRLRFSGCRLSDAPPPVGTISAKSPWPETADIVVIGAGIFGLCAALYLARAGAKVVLLEKGAVGAEASGRALVFLKSMLQEGPKQAMLRHSLCLWANLSRDSGHRLGLGRGLIFGASDDSSIGQWRDWCAQTGQGHDEKLLDDPRALLPMLRPEFGLKAAIYSEGDGYIEPRLALPEIAKLALKAGVLLHQSCAVRQLIMQNGKVSGVATEKGIIRCPKVVLAAGVWNSHFAAHLGFDLPQLWGFATAVEYQSDQPLPDLAGGVNGCSFRPAPDGRYVGGPQLSVSPLTPLHLRKAWRFRHALKPFAPSIDLGVNPAYAIELTKGLRWKGQGQSPFEKRRILAAEPLDYASFIVKNALRAPFGVKDVKITSAWSAALASTPDERPIIGKVPGHEGLFIGAGMYFGISFAPALAHHLSCQIMGSAAPFAGDIYQLSRFGA